MNFIFGQIFQHLMMRSLPLPEWLTAEQNKIKAKWASFFEEYDIMLVPVAPTVAFPHDHKGTIMTQTMNINGKENSMLNNMLINELTSPTHQRNGELPKSYDTVCWGLAIKKRLKTSGISLQFKSGDISNKA